MYVLNVCLSVFCCYYFMSCVLSLSLCVVMCDVFVFGSLCLFIFKWFINMICGDVFVCVFD